jgi:hypothetical protein
MKSKRFVLYAILGAVVCVVVGVCLAIWNFQNATFEKDATNRFLTALHDGRYADAHAMLDYRLLKQFPTPHDLENFAVIGQRIPEKWMLENKGIQDPGDGLNVLITARIVSTTGIKSSCNIEIVLAGPEQSRSGKIRHVFCEPS